ncbi:MAG: ZIP family metal transporter [Thermodesulfobacteriota bacterium]
MSTQLVHSLAYGTVAGLSSIAGVFILLANERWALRNSILFIGFAAGVMLTVAFLHILPEALEANQSALLIVLITLLVFYVLEHILMIHSCAEEECETHPMGWIGFVGIGFHSSLDGMAISIGFESSFNIGIVASIGVLLHKLPAGMNITALLLHTGYGRRRTLVMSLIVAVATPIGAIVAHLLFKGVSPATLGALLACSAGSFIYIAAADLLPETHRNSRKSNIILVIAGGLLVYMVSTLIKGH